MLLGPALSRGFRLGILMANQGASPCLFSAPSGPETRFPSPSGELLMLQQRVTWSSPPPNLWGHPVTRVGSCWQELPLLVRPSSCTTCARHPHPHPQSFCSKGGLCVPGLPAGGGRPDPAHTAALRLTWEEGDPLDQPRGRALAWHPVNLQ